MVLKKTTKKAIYLNNIFNYFNNILKLDYTTNSISIILVNNKSAKKLAEKPEFHKQSKYINIIYYYTI